MRDAPGPGRRLLAAPLRFVGLPHPRAPAVLLRGVLQFVRAPELAPVNFRPTLVEAAVGLFPELHLAAVGLTGGHLDVDVGVVGVAVERGHGSGLREVLRQVSAHHLLRLRVADLPVERIDEAVVRPGLAAAPARPRQLVLFELAHVFAQVRGSLLVAQLRPLALDVTGDVASPDALLLLLRRPLARDVADVRAGAPAAPDAHLEHHAHPLNSPAISPTTRSTCRMARSRYACEYSA